MSNSNDENIAKTIQSVDTVFTIVEYISQNSEAGVTEIANEIGVSKSTVHNHLKTLEQREYIRKDKSGHYVLGYQFLTLGGRARERSNLHPVAKPEINWLVEETSESACVATEEYGRIIYLYQARGEQAITTDSQTGTRVYPHCTALGKSILAHCSGERVDGIIDRHGLPKSTENTITSRETLRTELETIRERGYAFDDEERIEGLRCIAAPIMHNDQVCGAISVSGPAKRLQGNRFKETIPEQVRRAVRVIEMNLEYS
ncbi:IclR family transcriptional regulator [Halobacterium noricense]|uniref:IclR family transcriptional regulator n=1 Tax=Halobacterium noricense TaxID=223182 RepID=UPI001E5621D0|nr:IclR family transcriptional regulator [Halobacterium noricense]UHH23916.1 IclR family transcriptional regulator [Halobacterium noricense]